MKKSTLIILFLTGLLLSSKSNAQLINQLKNYGRLVGIFDGRTPCQGLAQQLEIETRPECIKIKWRLALFNDSLTGKPGMFQLWGFVYRHDAPITGKWNIEKGTATDPDGIVYRLDVEGHRPLYLQKLDDNILYFLTQQKKLMIGNMDFSFALNRVHKELQ